MLCFDWWPIWACYVSIDHITYHDDVNAASRVYQPSALTVDKLWSLKFRSVDENSVSKMLVKLDHFPNQKEIQKKT